MLFVSELQVVGGFENHVYIYRYTCYFGVGVACSYYVGTARMLIC